ncbi:C1 family peptidase [Agriterribacter sp.]|uniref:C1 family peptidase n=1 Tax=Agriterribacter sp. TaxID=2821509 RepID=UPI002B729FB5|nr:C1 family peptidase [Agriterribacter sp.]HRP55163.1 C1 family peptidase [Agriterribacter sp.]
MPIRMTDDPQDQQEQFNDGGGQRSGGGFRGGGGLLAFLPLLLRIFGIKGILVIAAIGIGGYFLLGRTGCGSIISQAGQLATGGILDPRQFQKASIYEALEEDDTKNPLPEAANLQRYAPLVGNQGEQGSCVAWSSAYAARSILEASRTGKSANEIKFSPAFLYNQIGLDGCQGSYIIKAMEYMTKQGSLPYEQFPYTDQNCTRQPSTGLIQQAGEFKMRGFNRLTKGDNTEELDMRAIKENLAQGAPVVIGMMVGESYMQNMLGKDVWYPEPGDAGMMGFGGHAQCVVGYDDTKYGGSFLIMNSWGPEWGNNGFAWVRYPDFKRYVREAYGLEPMAKTGSAASPPLECEIGLMEVQYDGKKTSPKGYIPLRLSAHNRFETTVPVKTGTRFKMEVKNSTECYIYVFGKETDGNSYTLFPYPSAKDASTTKYSPFCGITGYRLFPKDKSMTPDSIGTKDMMAVVVSKQPLDWYKLNQTISRQPGSDYALRVNNTLRTQSSSGIRYQSTPAGTIQFQGDTGNNQVAVCVVEISKQ